MESILQSSPRKPTPADRQYRRWVKVYCDVRDHGIESFGQILRPADESYNRHLNSRGWRDRLDALALRDVAGHRAGEETVYLAPKRCALGRRPAITLCFEIPMGGDAQRAQCQVDFLNHRLHDGLMYVERDDDGYRAYVTYTVPKERHESGERTGYSAAVINAVKADAARWLREVWAMHGWPMTVGVSGTLAEVHRVPGTRRRRCVRRSELFRAPRCRGEGSILQLQLSQYPAKWVPWFWWPEARAAALIPRSEGSIRRSLLETESLRACTFAALREFFAHTLPRRELRRAQLERIVRQALVCWRAHPDRGWHAVLTEDVVTATVTGLLRRILRKWRGPVGHGGAKGMHFNPFDIDDAEAVVRRRISPAAVRALNENPKLRSARVSYRALALTLCVFAKDSIINDGFVPTSAIHGMLRFWRITENGSLVKVLVDALKDAGLVRCTNPSYRVTDEHGPGYCRRYAVTSEVRGLTFVKDYLAEAAGGRAAARTERLIAPAAPVPRPGATSPAKYPNLLV